MIKARFSYIGEQLLHLIDGGESVSLAEVTAHIEDGTVLEWLQQTYQTPDFDLSLLMADDAENIVDYFQRVDNAYGGPKLGVTHNGLVMLAMYCMEAIAHDEHLKGG